MAEELKKRRGPVSLFPGKRRAPVSLTLTPEHHKKVDTNKRRLGITRADFIGLLIEKYAEVVVSTHEEHAYQEVRDAVVALGGTLEHQMFGGPHSESWVLELGSKRISIRKQGGAFPALQACYRSGPADGAMAASTGKRDIDPAGLADLFKTLASS